jgi:hypothetical protein
MLSRENRYKYKNMNMNITKNTIAQNDERELTYSGQSQNASTSNSTTNNSTLSAYETPELRSLDLARLFLESSGCQFVQRPDFMCALPNGQWIIVEVKDKELFTPGSNFPYFATGCDRSQLWLRKQLLEKQNIRTFLLTYVPGTEDVYGQFVDELQKGEHFDTTKTRVYPIERFAHGTDEIKKLLLGVS